MLRMKGRDTTCADKIKDIKAPLLIQCSFFKIDRDDKTQNE
jgi:hypothetical protein